MEDLTKQQIVLLTLLVSFITSIATGIVTVSLIEKAPTSITQTINRVVEKTVEKVVPVEKQTASVVTKETVVVRSDDLVVSAVEKNTSSLVRILRLEGVGVGAREGVAGIGVVISKDGFILTDSGLLLVRSDEQGSPIPRSFTAVFHDGRRVAIIPVGADSASGSAIFAPESSLSSGGQKIKDSVFVFSSFGVEVLKLGQTVILMGGEKENSIETGIVSSFESRKEFDLDSADEVSKKSLISPALILTDLSGDRVVVGSVILNLSGELVGMKIGSAVLNKRSYLSAEVLRQAIKKITEGIK